MEDVARTRARAEATRRDATRASERASEMERSTNAHARVRMNECASMRSRVRQSRARTREKGTRSGGEARERATGASSASDAKMSGANDGARVCRAPDCVLLSNEHGTYTVRGEMTLAGVDGASVYNLLTDYEASPRAFRAVKAAKILERAGDAVVSTNMYIEQECLWNFFVFGGSFPCAFEVEERDEEMKMKCSLAPGLGKGAGFLRRFEGSWAVEVLANGEVKVVHVLLVQPKLTPPYAHKIFVQQVEQLLADVVGEIERWAGVPYPKPSHRA